MDLYSIKETRYTLTSFLNIIFKVTIALYTLPKPLFRDENNYRIYIKDVLERRLEQIKRFDNDFHDKITYMINLLKKDDLNTSLEHLQGIREVSFSIIWEMELIEQKLSDSTIDYWNENESNIRNNKFKELIRDLTRNEGLLISTIDLRDQLIFLQYLTGCTIDHLSPKSRFVRKDTYYLLKTIGEFRNYRQHILQEAVEFHFVVNTILMCIELHSCLSRDFLCF